MLNKEPNRPPLAAAEAAEAETAAVAVAVEAVAVAMAVLLLLVMMLLLVLLLLMMIMMRVEKQKEELRPVQKIPARNESVSRVPDKRGDRFSLRVFARRMARVRVGKSSGPLGSSKVEEIVSWETGNGVRKV